MNDQDFDKSLDAWAEREAEAAPEMRPTAEMYHLVRVKKRAKPLSRWGLAGTAVAALMVIAVIYALLYQPSVVSPPSHEIAYVQIREGYIREKGEPVEITPTSPEKGEKRDRLPFKAGHRLGAEHLVGVALDGHQAARAALYRDLALVVDQRAGAGNGDRLAK